jgi:signal transduction histidine kinase/ActR/RegA family two-component response regulator
VTTSPVEERVLVLMSAERDNERAIDLLAAANVHCVACSGMVGLRHEIDAGAGAVLVADEIVGADEAKILERTLREQPPWSALPVIVLAREGMAERVHYDLLGGYNGVVVVERPVRTRSLVSAVQSALRARRIQYQVRDAQAELAEQAEQLRKADRLKNEFLATLAHELRNPLAPIMTGLALLAGSTEPAQRERTMAIMERQVRHMVRLIDDLLDVSRITRGKLELKRACVSLSDVVALAIEGSAPGIERGRHRLETDLPPEALYIDADLTRIAQVIGNLLNNAAKYTPNGGTIRLSVRRDGGEVVISVSDDGLGIPPERLDDIFEMFNQVNRVLDRSQGGLGIGLALVRKLVELHGGSVEAASAGPNKGSTFTVRLPLASPAPPAAVSVPPPAQPVGERTRVLVVDDNDAAAEMLSLMLQTIGYDTTTVHDGTAALAAARAVRPDIVVLDIGLPGISGYEVATELRRDPHLAQTSLIAVTGWGSPDDRRKAFDAGFDMHLTKPVANEVLKDALARVKRLRQRRANEPSKLSAP